MDYLCPILPWILVITTRSSTVPCGQNFTGSGLLSCSARRGHIQVHADSLPCYYCAVQLLGPQVEVVTLSPHHQSLPQPRPSILTEQYPNIAGSRQARCQWLSKFRVTSSQVKPDGIDGPSSSMLRCLTTTSTRNGGQSLGSHANVHEPQGRLTNDYDVYRYIAEAYTHLRHFHNSQKPERHRSTGPPSYPKKKKKIYIYTQALRFSELCPPCPFSSIAILKTYPSTSSVARAGKQKPGVRK